jgi:TolB protein
VRLASALLAAGAALLLASCGGSNGSDPDLVFVSSRDGEYAIYGMSAGGGDQRRLTPADIDPSTPQGLLFQTEPAWSPDGGTIAFVSKRSGSSDLYAMNADGTETRRLTSSKDDDAQPSWSADGKRIAFVRGTPGRLFVMAADGTGAHRVTDGLAEETEPEWSPDGRWIAYSHRDPGTSIRELWLVRPDGSQPHRLTKLGGVALGPSWSPDSKRIVFSANVDERGYDLHTIGADGKGERLLTSSEDAFEPSWSPDGKTIAFSQGGAIALLDIADGEQRTLSDPDDNDSSPTWKPEQGGTQ